MEIDFNTLYGLAFGLWAGVVGYLGTAIRSDLKTIAQNLKEESSRLSQYIVETETRLARIEQKLSKNGFH